MLNTRTLSVVVAAALAVAGCGGGETKTSTGGGGEPTTRGEANVTTADGATTVQMDVDPGELKFVDDEVTVPEGTVTFKSTNPDALEHNIAIKGTGVDEHGELVSDGGTSEVTVTLKKGESYVFYCVPHENAPMQGTITVT